MLFAALIRNDVMYKEHENKFSQIPMITRAQHTLSSLSEYFSLVFVYTDFQNGVTDQQCFIASLYRIALSVKRSLDLQQA